MMKKEIMALCISLISLSLPALAGTIQGRVLFQGKIGTPEKIRKSSDPFCASSGAPLFDEKILIDHDGLKNAFIYVKNVTATPPTKSTPTILDQKDCVYLPRVIGIQVGQPLVISNSDSTFHNVHSNTFNLGMPVQNMKITKTFPKPELGIRLKCDLHPWMIAWVHVVNNPYFAVSSNYGKYDIVDVPSGDYKIGLWHETLGEQEARVTVPSTGIVNLDFKAISK